MVSKYKLFKRASISLLAMAVCAGCAPVRTSNSAAIAAAQAAKIQKNAMSQACPTLHCVTMPDNKNFYTNVSSKAFDRGRKVSAIR